MLVYTVEGGCGTGWNREEQATSEKAARRLASMMRGSYDPRDTASRVWILRGGPSRIDEPTERRVRRTVAVWGGSESGRWVRVTP